MYIYDFYIYFFLYRAALFAQRMFMKAYANRTKAKILYATETGKSLGFAKQLAHIFSKAFKPEVSILIIF